MPSSCAVLGGFAIGAQISLLRQHSPNAKSQQVLCTLSMPRVHWQPWLFLGCFYKCSAAAEMGVVWPQDMAENWGLCPFWEGGAGFPCNTMRSGPRLTFVPSGILIHPAVWSQHTFGGWAVEGELGPHLTHCGQVRGIKIYT